ERAFARARRSGDADASSPSDLRVPGGEQRVEAVAVILDDADRTRERGLLAGAEIVEQAAVVVAHARTGFAFIAGSSCSSRMSPTSSSSRFSRVTRPSV